MPRPLARRKQFPAPRRDLPGRVTNAYNEQNINDLAEKLKDKPLGRVPNNSDDSDELVTKATNVRNRRGVARREVFASGGLGKGDEPATRQNRKRTSDTFKDLLDAPERPAGKKQKNDKAEKGSIGRKQNGRLAKAPTAPVAINGDRTRAHEPPVVKATLPGNEPSKANGLHGYSPPAIERSILADIKRRPRQASILSNVQLPGDDSLDNLTDFDLDDLDDLEPNDESTPIDSRTRTFHHRNTLTPSSRPGVRRSSSIPPTPAVLPRTQASRGPLTTQNTKSQHQQRSASPLRPVQSPSHIQERNDIYGPPLSSSSSRISPQRSPPPQQSPRHGLHRSGIPKTTNAIESRKSVSPQRQIKAPSTKSLENLMPQPRRKTRQRRQKADKDVEILSDTSSHSSPNPPSPTNDSSFLNSSQRRKQKGAYGKSAAVTDRNTARRKTGKDTTVTTTKRGKPAKAKSGTISQRKPQSRRSTTPPSNLSSLLSPSPPPPPSQSAAKNTQQPQQPSPPKRRQRQTRLQQRHQPPTPGPNQEKSNPSLLRPGSNDNDNDKENHTNPAIDIEEPPLSPSFSSTRPAGADGVLPTSSPPPPPLETKQAPTAGRRKGGLTANSSGSAGNRRGKGGGGGRESKAKGAGQGNSKPDGLELGLEDQLSAVRKKFEDVDGWGLEFEDVSGGSGSRGGSSPSRRWR